MLVKLLVCFYEFIFGCIFLDGVDLCDYELSSLWVNVGVIFQDFFCYQLKVRENIVIGCIQFNEEMDCIVDVVEKSLVNIVVDDLLGGYE